MKKMKLVAASFAIALSALALTTHATQAWTWSGKVRAMNKTYGNVLIQNGDKFYATSDMNVVFVPEGMGPNARHFTIMAKDMKTGNQVWGAYRTMVSRWSMENPTLDGTLGYTFAKGTYWLQVNAYQANGVGAGSYYAKLIVTEAKAEVKL